MLDWSDPLFDASSDPNLAQQQGEPSQDRGGTGSRPFLGIRFKCCRTYARIYQNDAMTAYQGRCPKCHAAVSVPIGEGGSSSRFFDAG